MAGPGLPVIDVIADLVRLPFGVARFAARRRSLPLPQRNLTRATAAAFVLAAIGHSAITSPILAVPGAAWWIAGVALVAGLYLCVGAIGAVGMPADFISVAWWLSLVAASSFAIVAGYSPRDPVFGELVRAIYAGLIVAGLARVALTLRPAPSTKLPHPSKVPGMPMAGPATLAAAHAALSRQRSASRPKFRT